ncbi:pseudouridine synthase [uncultured Parasphingorhabdus sp.]|uniref:pseudouridine synthase n=1 Tax=uncultured Parasphingorhabdus sp. TaxID=2709694 RepID=UPI0030DA3550|tara:strand:+ start:91327 stop:92139 length:813 start_codon:yes stop_codon:yes gene_type:complete
MTEEKPAKIYRAKPTPGAKPAGTPAAPSTEVREGQRIAKLLARAGVASRREIERMIDDGRIALNGNIVEHPSLLLKNLTGITVDGNTVAEPSPAKLYRFHKPNGYLTAERDFSGKKTIYEVLPADMERVMPIGRLDMNTEGLLLMTTDGEFKREMELPKNGIERSYRARTFGDISQNQLEELYRGITIEGMHYGPITANLERRTGRNQWIEMTLTEGKNREVRRVLEHFGLEVSRLIRTRYGPFVLGDLDKGEIEVVRQHDLVQFRKSLK